MISILLYESATLLPRFLRWRLLSCMCFFSNEPLLFPVPLFVLDHVLSRLYRSRVLCPCLQHGISCESHKHALLHNSSDALRSVPCVLRNANTQSTAQNGQATKRETQLPRTKVETFKNMTTVYTNPSHQILSNRSSLHASHDCSSASTDPKLLLWNTKHPLPISLSGQTPGKHGARVTQRVCCCVAWRMIEHWRGTLCRETCVFNSPLPRARGISS